MRLEDCGVGQQVNVKRLPDDIFNNDFTGVIVEVNNCYAVVRDQDSDCFSCEAEQLSPCSDEYMH